MGISQKPKEVLFSSFVLSCIATIFALPAAPHVVFLYGGFLKLLSELFSLRYIGMYCNSTMGMNHTSKQLFKATLRETAVNPFKGGSRRY